MSFAIEGTIHKKFAKCNGQKRIIRKTSRLFTNTSNVITPLNPEVEILPFRYKLYVRSTYNHVIWPRNLQTSTA